MRNGDQHDELCSEIRKFRQYEQLDKSTGKHRDDKVSVVEKIALRVIDLFDHSEVVYVVVDRADRCWDKHKIKQQKAFLKVLVKMVEAARSILRIVVVIDGCIWSVQQHEDELGNKTKGRLIIHIAHQGEDSF